MTKTYHDIRGQVEPYDIFLFSGRGFVSSAIRLATQSKWSHVGLSIRLPDQDWNLLLESTTLSDLPDMLTGNPTKGVQMVPLSRRISTYAGEVAWRAIQGPKPDSQMKELARFVREYEGRPYEQNQIELLRAALDSPFSVENLEDESSVFCSELVALCLRRLGILCQDSKPANEFTPADFAGPLDLLPGYTAADVVELSK